MHKHNIVAFELRGKFASFADPLGISNTFSLPIPTKTAVAGMIGSFVGIDNVVEDSRLYDFEYSVVSINPLMKQTFSQNFIADYTEKVKSKFDMLKKGDRRIESQPFVEPKPTNRELLINPKYIIFIRHPHYGDKLNENLKNRTPRYPICLGNSEFAGNFEYLAIDEISFKENQNAIIDSIFPIDLEIEQFAENSIYTAVRMATLVEKGSFDNNRKYGQYKTVIFSNAPTELKKCAYYNVIFSKAHSGKYHKDSFNIALV